MIQIEFDDRFVNLRASALKAIQARWRGAVVRNQLKSIRRDYEQLFFEIEGNKKHTICFKKGLFSKPIINAGHKRANQVLQEEELAILSTQDHQTDQTEQEKINDETIVEYSDDFESCSQTSQSEGGSAGTSHGPEGSPLIEGDGPMIEDAQGGSGQSERDTHQDNLTELPTNSNVKNVESEKRSEADMERKPMPAVTSNDNSSYENGSGIELQNREAMLTEMVSTSPAANQTSMWESSQNQHSPMYKEETATRVSKEDLLKQKKGVAMELLWVQQAICSRKQYLKLKSEMSDQK